MLNENWARIEDTRASEFPSGDWRVFGMVDGTDFLYHFDTIRDATDWIELNLYTT